MTLPKDPNMLLSYINTQLRDNYPSFDELCASVGCDAGEIKEKLENAGYAYNAELNRFVGK